MLQTDVSVNVLVLLCLRTTTSYLLLQHKHASHHSDSNAKWLSDITQITSMSYLLIVVLQLKFNL